MKRSFIYTLLVLTMLFWAANFHVVKLALEFYSPMAVATWRFFFGVLSLAVILMYQYGSQIFKTKFTGREKWHLFLTAFFGIFITIYYFNLGLKTTSAINGSLIVATSPAITGLLVFLFLKQKLSPIRWMAIFISFVGVSIILVNGDLERLWRLQFHIGDLYILIMATAFSLSQIIVNKHLAHIDATVLTAVCSCIALFLFICFSVPELSSTTIPRDINFWLSVLFMGILGTGVAYTAFYYCVVKLGPTTSTLYLNIIPFFALMLAFPFGEPIHRMQLVGGSIIIGGLILFGLPVGRDKNSAPEE